MTTGNACASSAKVIFSSPKTEHTSRHWYASTDEARADAFDYIERFYDPHRRHLVLDCLSPDQLEEAAAVL